jgi:phosphate transport system protein
MADEARIMVREALDAFVSQNLELAQDVLSRDDVVDSFKNQIFRELLTYMMADPQAIERALNLILIARNLERIGDHATNIAEDVIFAITGADIRHGARKTPANPVRST